MKEETMKIIGLIGGMSFESTLTYYQIINETIREELGGLHSAKIIVDSIDFAPLAKAQEKDDWDFCARLMIDSARRLEKAGAELILIGANTMHIVYEEIVKVIHVPVLHIANATISRLKKDGIKKVALLGTRYTMCKDFYKKRIIDAGIEVLLPKRIDEVNEIIYDELCKGVVLNQSKEKLLKIIAELKTQGAQGVILGCTELDLLVKPEDSDLPVYDTTFIHSQEAAYLALGKE